MPKKKKPALKSARVKPGIKASSKRIQYKCMMDDESSKFYCYKKVQGRWIWCNGIPYDTQEECDHAIQS